MSQTKRPLLLIFGNILAFIVIILSCELAVRIFSHETKEPLFSNRDHQIRGRPFIEKHPQRGFALISSYKSNLLNINKNGYRGKEFPDQIEKQFKILALGESTTFGWKVGDQQTYPSYLMKTLHDQGFKNIYVINGGVPSYSSSQVLLYLEEILEENKIKPELILINILWNDIWYSSIVNWYPDILVYQQPPAWQTFLLGHSKLYRLLILQNPPQSKRINVSNEKPFRHYKNNISKMIALCQKHNVSLAFVKPPFDTNHMPLEGLNQFHIRYTKSFFIDLSKKYIRALEKTAEKNNIPIIHHNLSIENSDNFELFMDTLHLIPRGNHLMAKDISEKLIRLKLITR